LIDETVVGSGDTAVEVIAYGVWLVEEEAELSCGISDEVDGSYMGCDGDAGMEGRG
jgi:hypothetical protein